ncbi:hypothetical protein CP985_08435 [Malaciobacter mytili LMG 24559]|uniref:Uncharacterized protein n=1 Tax=Malaciobacter mytili LMG 24559 TaxID=1032238 RepID=A0AAX2AFE9_9BACT|nr:hypothetical protein AMYT_a0208 [Malaciobacter mytili LMG 24559]RXK15464.1 hypothetical protein CP985_08435 [Malaciobacter mytili LMG 24559]
MIEKYSIEKCIDILLNVKNHKDTDYYKGKYKGFLYLKKLIIYIKNKKINLKHYNLYDILKTQKNNIRYTYYYNQSFLDGICAALYESMNFLSEMNQ